MIRTIDPGIDYITTELPELFLQRAKQPPAEATRTGFCEMAPE